MTSKLALPLALCLLLAGCATISHDFSPAPSPSEAVPTPEASPLPSPEWGEQVYMTAFSVEGRETPVFSPEYHLPKIQNADGIPAYEAVNTYYATELDDLASSSSELSAWAVDDYKASLMADFPFYAYADTESYELTMETPSRVSILRSHYSSFGTPAPALYPIGDTFDLVTGERLSFADLFTCPADQARERVLSALLALNAAGSYSNTVLDADALRAAYNSEQFYLTEDSLVCYYPSGDLPRAVGCPTFAIPYTELEDIFAPWE